MCKRGAENSIYLKFWSGLKIILGSHPHSFLDIHVIPEPCQVSVIYINIGLSKRESVMDGIKESEAQGYDGKDFHCV